MKTLRLFLQFIFVIANVLVVAFFIAAAYSDRVSPESSLTFSYLGLGFPILAFLNIAFIAYWVFFREWKYCLIGVVALLICWTPVRSYLPFHLPQEEVPTEDVLKILTYNVMGFGYKGHTKNNPNEILKYIANSQADIVCLQEYAEFESEKHLTRKKIIEVLHMYPYRSFIILSDTKYSNIGISVFSKYPLSESRQIRYKSSFNGSSIHQVNVKGTNITLVNNHLESFKLTSKDRSSYSSFIKNMGANSFEELRGSIGQKLGPAFTIRARQAEIVANEIKKAKSEYIIVCGDFNDTPISYAHRTVQGSLLDAFAESGMGLGVSYNQNLFWFRIDHILHSANMKAINCTVDKVAYSDHYPVWSYLQFKR